MSKLFFINSADYRSDAIAEFKEAIRNLDSAGAELAEGSLCDLARIFNRIIWTYEHKGIDTAVEIYWSHKAESGRRRLSVCSPSSSKTLPQR